MQDVARPDKSAKAPRSRRTVILPTVSTPAADPGSLDASLRSLRRSALVALALFALGIGLLALRAGAEPGAEVDRRVALAALALAGASILLRRSLRARASARSFVIRQVASVLCAVGLGLLGALLAMREGQWQVGLLYNLAGALLLLRPPARFTLARSPRAPVD